MASTSTSSLAPWRPWKSKRTRSKTALSPLKCLVLQEKGCCLVSLILDWIIHDNSEQCVLAETQGLVFVVACTPGTCEVRISVSLLFATPT